MLHLVNVTNAREHARMTWVTRTGMTERDDADERLVTSIEALSAQEVEALILELTSYSAFVLGCYKRWVPERSAPLGYDPGGLAIEAMTRVLQGRRRDWDPTKEETLCDYLKSVVKSIVTKEIVPRAKRGELEGSTTLEDGSDLTERVASPAPDCEEVVDVRRVQERMLASLEVEDDQLVLLCLFDDIVAPAAIAKETGLEQREIYRIKQKLRRRFGWLRQET